MDPVEVTLIQRSGHKDFLGSRPISGKNLMKIRSVLIKILVVIMLLSIGGGLRTTNDLQSVKETSQWQDRNLIKFSWIRSIVIFWLGAPLLVIGGGLRSTDEFKNVMATSLALDASLAKFS